MEEAPVRKVVLGRESRAGYAGAAVEVVRGGWSGTTRPEEGQPPDELPLSYKDLLRQEGPAERQKWQAIEKGGKKGRW